MTEWNLPTRPTKASDTRAKNFGSAISVELDAIEPNQLRALVQEAIERHLPSEQFEKLKAAEESERDIITRLVGKIARKRLRWREASAAAVASPRGKSASARHGRRDFYRTRRQHRAGPLDAREKIAALIGID